MQTSIHSRHQFWIRSVCTSHSMSLKIISSHFQTHKMPSLLTYRHRPMYVILILTPNRQFPKRPQKTGISNRLEIRDTTLPWKLVASQKWAGVASQYSVWLRTGRPGDRRSISGRGKRIFPLTSVSRPPLSPTQPLVQWVPKVTFPDGKARPGRDADHSRPSSAEVVSK
jgi:hypothetical protein